MLIGQLPAECIEIVEKECELHHSKLYHIKDYEDLADRKIKVDNQIYQLSSYASYQKHNATLALTALDIISEDYGFEIDIEKSQKAIYDALWNCRFEIVEENPRVILDGGHNINGIEALVKSFDQFDGSKCIIFSALKRKEYQKMIKILDKHCDKLVITTFDNKDAIDLDEFKDYETNDDYIKAIDEAISNYDNVLICGSLYFMSDVVLNYKF